MRIHIIEDDADILRLLEFNLEEAGHSVSSSQDGTRGLDAVQKKLPDFVLLDLNLPGLEGLEVCRLLKSDPRTEGIPVIIVSVRGRESDIVLGLGLGADDYLSKPFGIDELLARIKAVARRSMNARSADDQRPVTIGQLRIDPVTHTVRLADEELNLTLTEFRMLFKMASNPGRAFARATLISHAIGDDVTVMDHNVDVHISAIRRKLGEFRSYIDTIHGIGYRFKDQL